MRLRKGIVLAAMFLCFGTIYYIFDPSTNTFFPRCPFYALTKLKCPGCGSQRALHEMLHGNILDAVKYNALLVFSVPFIAFALYIELNKNKYNQLYVKLSSRQFATTYFVIIIIWWILRNIIII